MATKDTRFSGAHGGAKKPLTSRGTPKLKESPLPGRDWKTGTPSYIKNAASAAASKKDFSHSDHREHVSSRTGAPQHPADPRLARAGKDRDEV